MTSEAPEQPPTTPTPTEPPRTDVEKTLLSGSTYRSLTELGRSGAEARFEKGRRLVGWFLAQAMHKHVVAQRIAFFVLGLPGVGRSTIRTIIALDAITCLLSAFVSNTVGGTAKTIEVTEAVVANLRPGAGLDQRRRAGRSV